MHEHDAAEQAFQNGANYMKTRVLALLCDMKSTAMGKERFLLDDIREKVKKTEVRV